MQIADWRLRIGHHPTSASSAVPRHKAETNVALLSALLTLAGVLLRLVPWLTRYPLHRDEALYGAWARLIASGTDPLLLTAWIDKPPLVIYALAGSLKAFGVSELALRLPGMLASALTVPLTCGLARRAYGARTAMVAGLLIAVAPFAILFAPTAFTDPWLTLWLVAAAWAALAGRSFWAGLALGLAVASKQQGVLAAPLVIALLAFVGGQEAGGRGQGTGDRRISESANQQISESANPIHNLQYPIPNPKSEIRNPKSTIPRRLLAAALGFAAVFAPLVWWDSLRWASRPSFWDRGLTTYGGLALAPLAWWPERAVDWGRQLGYLFGLPAVSALLLGLAAVPGLRAGTELLRNRQTPSEEVPQTITESPHHLVTVSPCHRVTVDLLLTAYVLGYLALHFLFTFQPWDRYLLPLLPLVAVLAARGLTLTWPLLERWNGRGVVTDEDAAGAVVRRARKSRSRWNWQPCFPGESAPPAPRLRGEPGPPPRLRGSGGAILRKVLAAGLALAIGYGAWLGVAGKLPVGSDHGAYAGLDRVIALLRGQPADAVIYHRWLGWHYDFYLFDAPQERRWWGSEWKLADAAARTALAEPGRPQWLALPSWEDEAGNAVRTALASRGLELAERARTYRPDGSRSFTVYQIVPTRGRG